MILNNLGPILLLFAYILVLCIISIYTKSFSRISLFSRFPSVDCLSVIINMCCPSDMSKETSPIISLLQQLSYVLSSSAIGRWELILSSHWWKLTRTWQWGQYVMRENNNHSVMSEVPKKLVCT